jgi:NTE family protein
MKLFIALCLLPLFLSAQQNNNYKNLVMEGGGVRGLAYAGVINVLQQKNILQHIEKVGGSSAGAIAGFMICLGYSANEIDSMMKQLSIQQFNDGSMLKVYKRVKKDFGIYEGKKFEQWLQQLAKAKTGNANITFSQLHQLAASSTLFKDLYCTGTNLSKQRLEIFSYQHTANMPVALAVRISGGIPLYFEPVALDNQLKKIKEGDTTSFINYYVDGGMLCNYPISMFDTCIDGDNPLLCNKLQLNPHTIGIKLERPEQIDSLQQNSVKIPPYHVDNFNEYLAAFGNLMIETLNRKYPNLENEIGRTIYVSDANISPKVRRMKPEEKKLLYDNGVAAALKFFK